MNVRNIKIGTDDGNRKLLVNKISYNLFFSDFIIFNNFIIWLFNLILLTKKIKISQLEKSIMDLEKKEESRPKVDVKKSGVGDEKLEEFLKEFERSK